MAHYQRCTRSQNEIGKSLDRGDCARNVDARVPDSRQIDRVELQQRRSIQLRRRDGPQELSYRGLPDAQRGAGTPARAAGAQRGRGQRRSMREDEPGYRGDGYPSGVREYPGLRRIVGAEPIRGAAVGGKLAFAAQRRHERTQLTRVCGELLILGKSVILHRQGFKAPFMAGTDAAAGTSFFSLNLCFLSTEMSTLGPFRRRWKGRGPNPG